MRYFIDTEFLDTGSTIDLVSIGLVCEDGREYYAQSVEFDYHKASTWVKDNVLPHLQSCLWANVTHVDQQHAYVNELNYHGWGKGQCIDQIRGIVHTCPWRTREQIKRNILAFMDVETYGYPELYGWCCAYDFVVFCQLFGTMMDVPQFIPHHMNDLQQVLDERSITDDMLPQQEGTTHNALEDARYSKHLWEMLQKEQT